VSIWSQYRLRLKRRRLVLRGLRKRRELHELQKRTQQIKPDDLLAFVTLRNEYPRLEYFLKYYRDLGINHFLIVDNGSTDGSQDYLRAQPDVSLWQSDDSYRRSRFGMDWLTWLQTRYGHEHWCLTVDPDEFFVYPFCDTRPLRALTDWLDASSIRSFPAMLLDMYGKGDEEQSYRPGQNPFELLSWFDSGNYTISRNPLYGNLWIQGGPRARTFFAEQPERAPALNKIPLVRWRRGYAYMSSTHMLLPRGLNQVYDEWGGEKASGLLLHAKFLDQFSAKAAEEVARGEHYGASVEYRAYQERLARGEGRLDLWCSWSERYVSWRQLELYGLMSRGNWA